MGLKSDKWIRQQSTLPAFMVTERRPYTPPSNGGATMDVFMVNEFEYPSFESEETLRKKIVQRDFEMGVIGFRPLTRQEIDNFKPMIAPFEPNQVRQHARFDLQSPIDRACGDLPPMQKIVSYGTSSYGYDVRCADEFKIFTNVNSTIIDPKNFDEKAFVDFKGDVCIIPPNSFALARTVEYFRIPKDVITICLGKSTYARCGIIVNVTPFEPGWEGYVTLEFSNTTPLPAKIYANEGCAQVLFFQGDEPCETTYADRNGKYQGQVGVVPPRI
jgi:dCTP deaminase